MLLRSHPDELRHEVISDSPSREFGVSAPGIERAVREITSRAIAELRKAGS